jgi:hypothetical protein
MMHAAALGAHAGRPADGRDRELAARLLCRPGAPLEGFDPAQFVLVNGFDARLQLLGHHTTDDGCSASSSGVTNKKLA